MFKEFIRRVIWFVCEALMLDGEFACKPGTMKHRFLVWLYGSDAAIPVSDGWEYPDAR